MVSIENRTRSHSGHGEMINLRIKSLDYKLNRGGVLPEPPYAIVYQIELLLGSEDMMDELLKVNNSKYKAYEEEL